MAAGVPSGRIPPVAEDAYAAMGTSGYARNRLPGHNLLRSPEERFRKAERDRPCLGRDLRKAGNPGPGARSPRRSGSCRCSVRFGLGSHHVPLHPRRERHHILLILRSSQGASGPGQEIPRQRGSRFGQLLRSPELCGIQRRQLLLYSERS